MTRGVSFLVLFIAVLGLNACLGTQAPAPVTRYGEADGAGSAGVHAVIAGDTLWSVSNRYKISMRDIAVLNNVHAPFTLSAGQRLKLPPPQEYRVRSGDTLYSVSRLFGVNQFEIAQLNDLRAPYTVRAGDVLRLPSETRQDDVVEDAGQPVRLVQDSSGSRQVVGVESQQVKPGQKPSYQKPAKTVKPKARRTKITARTPKRSSSKFLQPVKGKVLSRYGPKKGGLHNDGINIAAARGTTVKAAENGVVAYAGNEIKGSGNLVLIRHSDRWMTAYAHMDGFNVKRGQVIKRGFKIGTVGSTGSVSKPQLHFEVRRGTEAINPKRYLSSI